MFDVPAGVVTESIEPLVRALAGTEIRELLSSKPSPEELFLADYGAEAAVA